MNRRDERRRRGRTRRRAALALVVALVVALGAEGTGRAFWRTISPRRCVGTTQPASAGKIGQMDRVGSTDVVFAGTSMAWQGLDPATFTAIDTEGRSAYNAGLAGGIPA